MAMAELMDVLNKDMWEKADLNSLPKMPPCMIGRHEDMGDGVFRYSVVAGFNNKRQVVLIEGASGKGHPLKGIANCDAIIQGNQIVAICVDDDCVRKKGVEISLNGC